MEEIALASTRADVAYVRSAFIPFPARAIPGETEWAGTFAPHATYRTPDGALWFARDWWRLYDDAGGIDGVRALFDRRVRAAARWLDHEFDAEAGWAAYVAGLYGACLRDLTPENAVLKEALVTRLERALADPRPNDARWCEQLRANVEMLDGLTLPFASCDRVRFGRTSRDRLIVDSRRQFPHVFA